MQNNDAPLVESSPLAMMGVDVQLAFDVDPAAFPNGVEFMIMMPGKLEAVGKIEIQRGVILLAVPPVIAANMRKQLHAAIADHQKKQAEAVGKVQ